MRSKVWLSKVLMGSLVMAVAAGGVSAQGYRRYNDRDNDYYRRENRNNNRRYPY